MSQNQSIGLRAALGEMERLGIQSLEVPEWKHPDTDEHLIIYWKPLTPEQIAKYHQAKSKSQVAKLNSKVIVDHATEKDGSTKLFGPSDYLTLSKAAHHATVNRIAGAIIGLDEPDDEDLGDEGADPLD